MNYEHFAIWLHGFLEISNVEYIDQTQTQIIKDHLALLFEKKTPDRSEKNKSDILEELKEKYSEFHVPSLYPLQYPVAPLLEPFRITCDVNSSTNNLCCEVPLGEQFKGVDLNTKFDAELHKDKTYC